jgi:hypothetical protein
MTALTAEQRATRRATPYWYIRWLEPRTGDEGALGLLRLRDDNSGVSAAKRAQPAALASGVLRRSGGKY